MGPKSKTDSELLVFPLVKFRKVWQNGNKHFALAGACFSGKSTDQFFFFCSSKQHKFVKIKKLPLQTLLFCV